MSFLHAFGRNPFMENQYYIYLLASKKNGTLYVGVTNNLLKRVWEHKQDLVDGFTKRYKVHTLVYFEYCQDVQAALWREKRLKIWKRSWKIRLIQSMNPDWNDLYDSLLNGSLPKTCRDDKEASAFKL